MHAVVFGDRNPVKSAFAMTIESIILSLYTIADQPARNEVRFRARLTRPAEQYTEYHSTETARLHIHDHLSHST